MILKKEIKVYVDRVRVLRGNLTAIFAIALGQCSEAMKTNLQSPKGYDKRCKQNNCHWLFKSVLPIMLQFNHKQNGRYLSIMDASQSFLNCSQSQEQTVEEYLESLTLWAYTIKFHGGTFVENYRLASEFGPDEAPRTEEERRNASKDETLAMALIRGADPTRYGTLLAKLLNQFAIGRNNYPIDLSSAYGLLVNYRTP
jgi:hypothetical protein